MIPSHDEIEVPEVVRRENENESTQVQQKEISIITKGKRVKSKRVKSKREKCMRKKKSHPDDWIIFCEQKEA